MGISAEEGGLSFPRGQPTLPVSGCERCGAGRARDGVVGRKDGGSRSRFSPEPTIYRVVLVPISSDGVDAFCLVGGLHRRHVSVDGLTAVLGVTRSCCGVGPRVPGVALRIRVTCLQILASKC